MQIGEQTVSVSSFVKRDERDNPAAQQLACSVAVWLWGGTLA